MLAAVLAGHVLLWWLVSLALHPTARRPTAAGAASIRVPVRLLASRGTLARLAAIPPVGATVSALRQSKPELPSRKPATKTEMPPFSRAPRTQPEPISVSAPTLAASAPEDQTRREADAKPSSNPPPLDLRLPASPRSPGIGGPATPARLAIEAQVGRYAIRTPEARMAHRLAAEWTVENLGDGRVRMRRGDDCIMLNETQASQLDPWNNRGTAPRGAGPCAP